MINNEGTPSLTQRTQELDVVVYTTILLEFAQQKRFFKVVWKTCAYFSKSIEFDKFGIITCAGISIGKKVSINAELFYTFLFQIL